LDVLIDVGEPKKCTRIVDREIDHATAVAVSSELARKICKTELRCQAELKQLTISTSELQRNVVKRLSVKARQRSQFNIQLNIKINVERWTVWINLGEFRKNCSREARHRLRRPPRLVGRPSQ
jgi:hypothetical protein